MQCIEIIMKVPIVYSQTFGVCCICNNGRQALQVTPHLKANP